MGKDKGLMVINNHHFTSTLSPTFYMLIFFFNYPILVLKIYLIGEWDKKNYISFFFFFHLFTFLVKQMSGFFFLQKKKKEWVFYPFNFFYPLIQKPNWKEKWELHFTHLWFGPF